MNIGMKHAAVLLMCLGIVYCDYCDIDENGNSF